MRVEARRVVVGRLERLRRARLHGEPVLERVDLRHVAGVARVDEDPGRDADPRRVELLHGQAVLAGLVEEAVDVVILVDHHHRHVAVAAVRERERGPFRDVDDRGAVERVAVHPDHGLLIDRRRLAVVPELVDPAGLRLEGGEHPGGLGAGEVLDGHR